MDPSPPIHPTPETLRAYGLGTLDEASARVVGEHLEICPECRRRASELAIGNHPESVRQDPHGAETAGAEMVTPIGHPTEARVAHDVTLESVSAPCMSATGPIDGTSDQLSDADGAGLERGTRVGYFGDYELLKVLGEGGMGIVYKARQLSLNRPVALKMIKASRFPSTDEVRRFQNEAEAVARLDHPNIVPIFEVGQFEDQHYFSMKLVGAESLDKRLKDYTADPRRAALVAVIVAGAVHHAHQRGILHRDLKPANILLDAEGQPHVTDFGLAKRVEGDSELTQSGAIVGTPAYMAPEQASLRRGAVTTSTDVYGVGAILFALLTGRAPFAGTTVLDTLEKVREIPPESPRKLNPRVPRDLEVICLKCLEKDPRRRYASADALTEDLKRWLEGEPILARPVGKAARAWMWCRRNPAAAAAVTLTATALSFVAVGSLLYARQQTRLSNEQSRRLKEQADSSRKIARLNKSLEQESGDLRAALTESNRRTAISYFERARRSLDGGQVNSGLLWLIESWRYAQKANDRDWEYLARANLAYWRYSATAVKAAFPGYLAHSRDGRVILTQRADGTMRLCDFASGRSFGQPMFQEGGQRSASFSPDGKLVVTYSDSQVYRLWNAATGRSVGEPMKRNNSHYFRLAAFSPDSRMLATVSGDLARLWNTSTGLPIGRPIIGGHPGTLDVIFSPDGILVVTHDTYGTAQLRKASDGEPIGEALPADVAHLAFSPDSKTILTGQRDKTARLWNASNGLPIGRPMIHNGWVFSVAFAPDGKTIATGSRHESARLWNTASQSPIGPPFESERKDRQKNLPRVAFSPDGISFVSISGKMVQLGNVATGLPVGEAMAHQEYVQTAEFDPDSKFLLTVTWNNTARLWDAATGLPLCQPWEHPILNTRATYNRDGGPANPAGGVPLLWEPTVLKPVGLPLHGSGYINSVLYAPNGKTVLTVGATEMRLWDTTSGACIGQPIADTGNTIRDVLFSSDGKAIFGASYGNSVRQWNAESTQPTGPPINLDGSAVAGSSDELAGNRRVKQVKFSPTGKIFLTAHSDGSAQLWNAASGKPIKTWSNAGLADFSPDCEILITGTLSRAPRLRDSCSGRAIGAPLEHDSGVRTAAFSPTGKTIVTVSEAGTSRLWNTSTALPIGQPMIHQGIIEAVAFSPDGEALFTSVGQVVRRWDTTTCRPIGRPITFQYPLGVVLIGPHGKTLMASTSTTEMRLWDANTGQPIGPVLEHNGRIAAFSPNGDTFTTIEFFRGRDPARARLWQLPNAVDDDISRMKAWVEALTGMSVDDEGGTIALETEAWQARRDRLRELGGPPPVQAGWLSDPILYGPDPLVRARSWAERKCWAKAEAAFGDVIHAWPKLSRPLRERGEFYLSRSRPDKAVTDFVHALEIGDTDFELLVDLLADEDLFDRALALLAGRPKALSSWLIFRRADHLTRGGRVDQARAVLLRAGAIPWDNVMSAQNIELLASLECSSEVSALLTKYRQTTDPFAANLVAWCCALAPQAIEDHQTPVRLAEFAVKNCTANQKDQILSTLGAVLYRAGRFEQAIHQLEEGIQIRKGRSLPEDWAFLAMAYQCCGRRNTARGWLDRFRRRAPRTQPDQYWEELKISRLRSEAEAVVLYDPVFPADPFAH